MRIWSGVTAARALLVLVIASSGLACDARIPLDPVLPGPVSASHAASADGSTAHGDAGGAVAPPDPAQIQQDLLARWNLVADGAHVGFNFHWSAFDKFPHPTYQGGSADAYRAFAEVLLGFFQHDDDFAFLAADHLFGVRLRYVFPSGQVGIDTSFKELGDYFSASSSFGAVPDATRAEIKAFVDRMTI